jgi:hypothetical protein
MVLLANKMGVLRLFKGWMDHAARAGENAEKGCATVYVKVAKNGKERLKSYALVEKDGATLAKLAPRGEFFVYSHNANGYLPLPEYVAKRAERKAKKLAKKAAKLSAAEAQAKAEATVAKVLAELTFAKQTIEYTNDGPTSEAIAAAEAANTNTEA